MDCTPEVDYGSALGADNHKRKANIALCLLPGFNTVQCLCLQSMLLKSPENRT